MLARCLRRPFESAKQITTGGVSMDQLNNYSDNRLLQGCIYCDSGLAETRDHVPSRVFLERPYPENLPVVAACFRCNNGFSLDEEYVACVLEAVASGSVDPSAVRRESIRGILTRNVSLRAMIAADISQANGQTSVQINAIRFQSIAVKLARGHAAFELGLPFRAAPSNIQCVPLYTLSLEDRQEFEDVVAPIIFGEIGSRELQRLRVVELTLQSNTGELSSHTYLVNDWVEVQEGRYRYLATTESYGARVRIVLGELMACEVIWED
jgi:hypothetical protein